MTHPTLKGWLVAFVYAAARETDQRTGSNYARPIRASVEAHSPVTALEWLLAELSAQVSAVMAEVNPRSANG